MALRTAYLTFHRQADALFAGRGVTADQFVLLAALAEGDAVTQQDLVRRVSSDPNAVARCCCCWRAGVSWPACATPPTAGHVA